MPQGVSPPAQLLRVPATWVPVGSAEVLRRSAPAAGPTRVIGVVPVRRRLYAESRTGSQAPSPVCLISTMLTPWASSSTATISAVGLVRTSAMSTCRLPA